MRRITSKLLRSKYNISCENVRKTKEQYNNSREALNDLPQIYPKLVGRLIIMDKALYMALGRMMAYRELLRLRSGKDEVE